MQVLVLASGSFLHVIGDTSSLSCDISDDFVRFPSIRAERDDIKESMFRVGGFPCAIGFIDGTHLRIAAPHENEPTSWTGKDFTPSKCPGNLRLSR